MQNFGWCHLDSQMTLFPKTDTSPWGSAQLKSCNLSIKSVKSCLSCLSNPVVHNQAHHAIPVCTEPCRSSGWVWRSFRHRLLLRLGYSQWGQTESSMPPMLSQLLCLSLKHHYILSLLYVGLCSSFTGFCCRITGSLRLPYCKCYVRVFLREVTWFCQDKMCAMF